jgi:hypothetical protein
VTNKKINLRFGIITGIILIAALSRIIPHPANFAPISAMALFGAVYFSKKYIAFIIPLISMWISDLVINNTIYAQYFDHFVWLSPGFYWTYGAFFAIAFIGLLCLQKLKLHRLLVAGISSSILFFLISNFGVWMSGTLYPNTFSGLIECYVVGIPFLKNTVLGDLFYMTVLFGSFELVQWKVPAIKLQTIRI